MITLIARTQPEEIVLGKVDGAVLARYIPDFLCVPGTQANGNDGVPVSLRLHTTGPMADVLEGIRHTPLEDHDASLLTRMRNRARPLARRVRSST